MSQNLDATAINQIHALISAQGVNEIGNGANLLI